MRPDVKARDELLPIGVIRNTLDCRLRQFPSLLLVMLGTQTMSMYGTIAAIYFAVVLFGAWNTQSLPVVVNDSINLMTLQTRVLGQIRKK